MITQSDWLNILVFVGKAGQSRRDRPCFVETPLLFHLRRPPQQAKGEVGGGACVQGGVKSGVVAMAMYI